MLESDPKEDKSERDHGMNCCHWPIYMQVISELPLFGDRRPSEGLCLKFSTADCHHKTESTLISYHVVNCLGV